MRCLAATPDDVPLLLLTAPAGYGKTTVLAQWAAEDPRPFAWVDLDEADDDPRRLLRHVALALQRIRPLDLSVWRALRNTQAAPLGVVLPRLVTAATAASPPWVLVLDDVQLLRSAPAAEVVTSLADCLPAGFHLVVSGRSQSELRLSGLRARGRCTELGGRELAFSSDEVGAVLGSTGMRPSGRVVADLLRRTEGWPAGVYLAALSPHGRSEPGAAGDATARGNLFALDFLRQEVLLREPEDTITFLLRTAPLRDLSGPLCDSVLDATGSAGRLAEMAGRNLFVALGDADHGWFRYHPLFRELLLAELRRRDPGEEERAHRRASAWYESQGRPQQAIDQALAGRDTERVARLIAGHGQRLLNEGRIRTIRGWLFRIADGALPEYPELAVVAGWIWALTGDAARAHECLRAAEQQLGAEQQPGTEQQPAAERQPETGRQPETEQQLAAERQPETGQRLGAGPAARDGGRRHPGGPAALAPDPSLVGAVARLRAALAPNGVQQMLVDARQAIALEPPGGDWYPMAALLYGSALLLNDEPDAAARMLERAAYFASERQRSSASLALAQLSLLFADEGDWSNAAAYATEAASLAEAGHLGDYLVNMFVNLARARLAWHRGDSRGARQWIGKALRLYVDPSPAAFPWLAAQTAIRLGQALLDLEDHAAARRMVNEARRHLAKLPAQGTLAGGYARLAGALSRRSGPAPATGGASALTAAELRVLRLLPTHLTLSEIADSLYLSRNTVKTQVASIYGKLLASNRAEAVRTARDLNLLD